MANITTPQDVKSGDKTTLAVNITATQTSGIKFSAITRNGTTTNWQTESGIAEIREVVGGDEKVEWMSFNGLTVNSDSSITLTAAGVGRGLDPTADNLTASGTGQAFSKNAEVRLVVYHHSLNQKADVDRANTFSKDQTFTEDIDMAANKELRFDTQEKIYSDGVDLILASRTTAATSLEDLAAAAGTDEKSKVSSNDTNTGYLSEKITGGDGITVTEINDAGDEDLDIDVELATDSGLEFSSNKLRAKVKTNGGVTRDSDGLSVDLSNEVLVIPKYSNTADSTTVVSTTSETDLDKYYTIPANDLAIGDVYRMKASLIISTASGGSGHMTLRLKFGSTTLATWVDYQDTSTPGDDVLEIEACFICRTIGGTGTISPVMKMILEGSVNWQLGNTFFSSPTPVTVDTTANAAFKLTAQPENNSVNDSAILRNIIIEKVINPN